MWRSRWKVKPSNTEVERDRSPPLPLQPSPRPARGSRCSSTGIRSAWGRRGPSGSSDHQLLAEQVPFNARQVDAVLPCRASQARRNAQRALVQVEKVIGKLEPDPLARADHAGQENQPLRVLREPRREP